MNHSWHPSAPLVNIQLRAKVLKSIRAFFEEREVLEVETPLICYSTVTDPQLTSFETTLTFNGTIDSKKLFLQTSPEFAMKRLLAAGYGSIYQICKAFRNGEMGKKHNPEFTILEWYRVGFTHWDLMDEIDLLMHHILQTKPADRISYLDLFTENFGINPHTCSTHDLKQIAEKKGLVFNQMEEDKDTWLDLLMSHLIEPTLGKHNPVFIFDYPETQAALAKTRTENGYKVGERFELYYKGIELANGYHELGDPEEQLNRFNKDNEVRNRLKLTSIPIDKQLLAALAFFPACAGVALGLDRLLCLAGNTKDIAEIISFPTSMA